MGWEQGLQEEGVGLAGETVALQREVRLVFSDHLTREGGCGVGKSLPATPEADTVWVCLTSIPALADPPTQP